MRLNRQHDGQCDYCSGIYYAKGLCKAHYDAKRIHGDIFAGLIKAEQQGHVCAICGQPPKGKRHHAKLHADHDHETGQRRGLLCGRCNTAIGLFQDDINRLESAIRYLDHWTA